MGMPVGARKAGIAEKIAYAEQQRNQLDEVLWGAYAVEGKLPQFVAQRAENILSQTRECFDHLGRDLIEGHLLPHAKASFVRMYNDGKVKCYFPFYLSQLTQEKERFAFFGLKAVNPTLYGELLRFVQAIDAGQFLANTSFNVRLFRVVQELVNEKKHSRLTEYHAAPNEKLFYEGPSSGVLLDRQALEQQGALQVDVQFSGIEPKAPRAVPAFKFTATGHEVSELCLFAVRATGIVMDIFYDKFFAPSESVQVQDAVPTVTFSDSPSSEKGVPLIMIGGV